MPALQEGLPGSLTVALSSRVRTLLIVLLQPDVQVRLLLLQGSVQLHARRLTETPGEEPYIEGEYSFESRWRALL